MGDTACKLCIAVREHPDYAKEPRPDWLLLPAGVRPAVLVATEHAPNFDLESVADRCALLGAGGRLLDHAFVVDESRGWLSKRFPDHPRVYCVIQQPYQFMPQPLADAITEVAQSAVAWFHDHSVTLTAVPTATPITDEQVRERIQGFQFAMDREIARCQDFRFEGAWEWRWDADWKEKHNEWIAAYMEWDAVAKPGHSLRYDLSALPFQMQRAICTRWQRLWEEKEKAVSREEGP